MAYSSHKAETIALQPSYPEVDGKFVNPPARYSVWVVFDNVGWTDRESAEAAIEQAIGFLSGP